MTHELKPCPRQVYRGEAMICAHFVNAGNIPVRQSAENALAGWANDNERRLLGLHCGQFLPRERHKDWAAYQMLRASIHVVEIAGRELTFVKVQS